VDERGADDEGVGDEGKCAVASPCEIEKQRGVEVVAKPERVELNEGGEEGEIEGGG
jgi:hypothetical protein